jgi:hypothetical protein
MNSKSLVIILDIYLHTYAICRTSGRIVLGDKSFHSLACFRQFLKMWSIELSPFCRSLYRRFEVGSRQKRPVSGGCRQPLTTEDRVRSQAYPFWGLWWTEWHWDRFFLSECVGFPLSASFHLTKYIFIYQWRDTSLAIDGVVKQRTWRNWETEWCFQPQILGTWICQKTYNALVLVANVQRGRYVSTRF